MTDFSCEMHIDQVLEDFIEKYERFPRLDFLTEKEKLSTKCSQCEKDALYVVANE